MNTSTSPRRVLATATLLLAAAGSGIAANADDQPPASTGHCAKTFSVSTPTTLRCSFEVSEASHSFGGGGWEQPQDGSVVALWDMTISVNGELQPLNYCAGALYSGCVTGTWSDGTMPAGTVIECTVRAVGRGNFSCDSYRD